MSYLDKLLGQDESILLVAHRHISFLIVHMLPTALVTILLWVGAGLVQSRVDRLEPWLALAIVGVSIVTLTMTVSRFLTCQREEYVITNYRILQIEGVFTKRTLDSALEKVNDVLMTQSVLGRLFGYGNIDILTGAERGINNLTGISDPFEFKRTLMNAKMQLSDIGEGDRRPVVSDHARLVTALTDLRAAGVISPEEFEEQHQRLVQE